MSGKGKVFRSVFNFGTKDLVHYFPGHMAKGINQIQRKLIDVDCIIEVHDARIPFSGRTPTFQETTSVRPHLLLLNKMDLADTRNRKTIESQIKDTGVTEVLYTNCKDNTSHAIKKQILPTVVDMINDGNRYNRKKETDFNLLILGIPNVGKSSLINSLRSYHIKKAKAAPVGATPGITRSVMEKIRVSDHPRIYVFDSPGILNPVVEDIEAGMKLALCGSMKDNLVGEIHITDYLLFWLNKHGIFKYVTHYGFPDAVDNVLPFLAFIAHKNNKIEKRKSFAGGYAEVPNLTWAADRVLKDFRRGLLGKINLDMDLLDTENGHSNKYTHHDSRIRNWTDH